MPGSIKIHTHTKPLIKFSFPVRSTSLDSLVPLLSPNGYKFYLNNRELFADSLEEHISTININENEPGKTSLIK